MPLSTPTERKLTHTRVVTCLGYERHDKLWDIEGRIVDTKPYAFPNKDRGGEIKADEPLHDMSSRLTIDTDLKVLDAEAVIDDSPYNYCKCVTPIVKQLIGLQIAHGWTLKKRGDNEYWCRPGKTHGTSATLKDNVFYVFSTNAFPFEPGHGYSNFHTYTLLEHGKNEWSAAAAALRQQGYGDRNYAGLPSQPVIARERDPT